MATSQGKGYGTQSIAAMVMLRVGWGKTPNPHIALLNNVGSKMKKAHRKEV